MIAVDTNILVYAHRGDMTWHSAALRLVVALAEGERPWMIPWPCVHEFMSVVTNRRIFSRPSTTAEAIAQVEVWRQSPSLRMLAESPGHWDALRALATGAKAAGGLFHDARVAAICVDHGVETLWTADRDFARFPSLRTENPLVRA